MFKIKSVIVLAEPTKSSDLVAELRRLNLKLVTSNTEAMTPTFLTAYPDEESMLCVHDVEIGDEGPMDPEEVLAAGTIIHIDGELPTLNIDECIRLLQYQQAEKTKT